jgi:uncharacterized protein (DUF1501 family)
MSITRRVFLRNSALAVVGTASVPPFLTRTASGSAESGTGNKRLIVIFQRGAADGLNIVVPHGEQAYYAMRPSINIPGNAVIDLDGFFGLHPELLPLLPLWKQRHLAIVHATGSPHSTRSHFEAQDFMESGTPGVKATEDGWLNRVLHSLPQTSLLSPTGRPACEAITPGPSLPRILSGARPVLAVNSNDSLTLEAAKMLKSADPAKYKPAAGADYPSGHFGNSLQQLAQLLKANMEVQVGFADIGGWDHHVNEGGTHGQLANLLRDFSQSLAAFWIDLGDVAEDTVVVTMSEFGRAARENGNCGTDHGHANVMFVMGGPVKGGKVYGRWPGLDPSQLYEGRDLAVTTDFRQVLGEAVYKHLGNKALDQVFPGFENKQGKFLKYLG